MLNSIKGTKVMEKEEIGFCHAEIVKVASNVDGSCRITLDIPEYNSDIAKALLEIKMSSESLLGLGIVRIQDGD
jgi:hypothetical protein